MICAVFFKVIYCDVFQLTVKLWVLFTHVFYYFLLLRI